MLLELNDIKMSFKKEHQTKIFGKERQQVLKGVSLKLDEGECLGLVGESGSGKSTLGRVICGLSMPDSGEVLINEKPLYIDKKKNSEVENYTSIVFQDYTSSINPRFTIKSALFESFRVTDNNYTTEQKEEEAINLLNLVGLGEKYLNRYPHELSGGQLQRVCIARAVAVKPKVIILDEAVSSLDAATQTQVMDLLIELRKKYDFSYLFITHDLTTITYLCDRVLFFQNGEVVEEVNDISKLSKIEQPYVKKLLNSVIGLDEVLIEEDGNE